ncbi:MAG: hypothetical protein WKF84_24735 [Pyrinomonadaceae bacterium]
MISPLRGFANTPLAQSAAHKPAPAVSAAAADSSVVREITVEEMKKLVAAQRQAAAD